MTYKLIKNNIVDIFNDIDFFLNKINTYTRMKYNSDPKITIEENEEGKWELIIKIKND